ncbi:MAG: tRNA lysidine(34) synthetase TilS [Salibacteraceae bacterium]|nr:tRNA lysidine(34) synthetase TilS [Salibacteraceae bacterium]
MLSALKQHLLDTQLLTKTDHVLVAVSGGKDSMVLLHLLHKAGYKLAIAHINYQLRGADSDADEALVIEKAQHLGLEIHIKKASIDKAHSNVQEAAREIRYQFFNDLCASFGYTKIATAHHANDALETLFIQLMRGTGIHGLKAIPAQRENVVRPMLWASRQEIDAFAEAEKIAFRQDVSNLSDAYLRNRIRHHLLPLIEHEIDPTAITKLKTSIKLLAEDGAAVKAMADSLLSELNNGFSLDLSAIPEKEKHTWVYHAISRFGFNRDQAKSIVEASENGKQILSHSSTCVKRNNTLFITSIAKQNDHIKVEQLEDFVFESLAFSMRLIPVLEDPFSHISKDSMIGSFDADKVHWPLTFGHAFGHEQMQPFGSTNQVKLKKLIYGLAPKPALALKDAEGEIIWLHGLRTNENTKITGATKRILVIETKD